MLKLPRRLLALVLASSISFGALANGGAWWFTQPTATQESEGTSATTSTTPTQTDGSSLFTSQVPAASTTTSSEQTQMGPETPGKTVESVSTGSVTPLLQGLRMAPSMLGAPPANMIDPSDLSTWTVFDHYYNPSWGGVKPAGYDENRGGGYHPFFYWKDNYSNQNPKFYDLENPVDKARLQTEVFGPSAPRVMSTPCIAYFSQHIYTEGTANNAAVTFLGYGETFKTDWAIAPVTSRDFKALAFDIDASKVNPHTLDGFGVMINAGVDRNTDTLYGYLLTFKMANNTQGTTSGTIYLIDYSNGVKASSLHDGLAGYARVTDLGTKVALGNFDIKNSPMGKMRLYLDIEPTELTANIGYYTSQSQPTPTLNYTKTLVDTNRSGFGTYVNYNGDGHWCERLSSVTFSNMIMSVPNYSVIFDGNGATTQANPDRINDVRKGYSLADEGYAMPQPPTRAGYLFTGWNLAPDGSGVAFTAQSKVTAITTVYAQWKQDDATVTYTADANSTLAGSTSERVTPGGHVASIPTVTPNKYYTFAYWEDQDGTQYTPAALAALAINQDMTFKAVCTQMGALTVTYAAGANGTLTGGTTESVMPGDSPVSVPTPVPNAGYEFKHWSDGTKTYADDNAVKAAVINANVTFTAVFDQIADYTVTYAAGPNGTLTGPTSEVVPTGDKPKTVPTPVPNAGYEFKYWQDQAGQQYPTAADVMNTPITSTTTFTAVFDKIASYTVTYAPGANGTLTGPTTETVNTGDKPTTVPTPVPNAGYEFKYWQDQAGKQYPTATDVKNTPITGATTFTAIFDRIPSVTIAYAAGANGTLNGPASELVQIGASPASIPTAVPALGFLFQYWEDQDGTKYVSNADVALIVVTKALNLTAVFGEVDPLTVTYVAGQNGTLTGPLTESVKYGRSPVAVPIPLASKYYEFKYWEDQDLNHYNTAADIQKVSITHNMTFKAVFDEMSPYQITFVPGQNGTLSGNTTAAVKPGDTIAAVPTTVPNTNYQFAYWQDSDGVKYPTDADLLKAVISKDMTITAVFEACTYKFDYKAGQNGTLNGPTTEAVKFNDSPKNIPTPVPNAGYEFAYWEDQNGKQYKTPADLAQIKASADTTLTAVFVLNSHKVDFVAGSGGTINGTTSFTVKTGNSVPSVPNPVPNAGSKFQYWEDQSGNQYKNANQVMKVKITGDTTFTAVFDITKASVKYVAGKHGSITGAAIYNSVANGARLSVVAPAPTPVADPGFCFKRWEDNTGAMINPATAVVGPNTKKITAVFAKDSNGDGIDDETQTKAKVTLEIKGPGRFNPADETKFNVVIGNSGFGTLGQTSGFVVPQLIPDKTVDPTVKFWWWEDAKGNKIANLANEPITKNITFFAFFDTDINGNDIPDSKEECKFTVEFKSKGNGSLTGKTKFDVAVKPSIPGILGNAIGGYTEPRPVPAANYMFLRWEDADGNTIANTRQYKVIANTTIYAVFAPDENHDNIPDCAQNKYILTFVAGQGGSLSGKTVFTLIGGRKGDGRALTLANVVGGFNVPTIKPDKGYEFAGWSPVSNLNMLSIKADTTITATFKRDCGGGGNGGGGGGGNWWDNGWWNNGWWNSGSCTIIFYVNGSVHKQYNGNMGSKYMDCMKNFFLPSAPNGYIFTGWKANDGKIYTMTQVMTMVISGNQNFQACYSKR